MAASPVPSGDVSDDEGKKKRHSVSKGKKDESEVEDSEGEGDEGEEEEYEIEAILDAKKGQFEKGKLGYFVKWKGYSDEHNSWVTEEDAGNAKDLITAYWDKDKKKSSKKAAETTSSKRTSRKSVGADNASDAGGSASAPVAKKRGRKPASAQAAEKEDDERPAKKPRKSTEKKTVRARSTKSPEVAEEEEIGNMAEHMQAPTWDQLVKHIDTVERADDGKLFVYFTLNGGERIREDSKVCGAKFPQKLLQFYENNLRWKEADQ